MDGIYQWLRDIKHREAPSHTHVWELFSVGFPSAVIWLTSPQHLKDRVLKHYVSYQKNEFYMYEIAAFP